MSRIPVLARAVRALAVCAALLSTTPNGSPEKATGYYKKLSKTLGIRTPDTILNSNLDEVLEGLGYKGLTAIDLVEQYTQMQKNGSTLGFVLKEGEEYVEAETGAPVT